MKSRCLCGESFLPTFHTPWEEIPQGVADHVGQPFTVVKMYAVPDETHDLEVLPMYRVRFPDGFETDAWPEEVMAD
jgi:hypothetical protein